MDIPEFFQANYFWIDFSLGTGIFLLVILLRVTRRIQRVTWILYWVGFILGLCWELPMSIANEIGVPYAPARFITPLPVHYSVIVITHSWWDGGLFLVGLWLVMKLCKEPPFDTFRFQDLGVMIAWGQVSELLVELSSTYAGGWEFIEHWWNPVLFRFNGHNITLLPQLIWLVASVVFYLIVIRVYPKFTQTNVTMELKEESHV